ncbi:signal peptidase I [Microbacterium sp. nov. GSS16]|uniref:signal peptidase I n=1 Tax=Microbacterium sp. nov. GSS16 TaxID=3019890 RepID=UPI0023066A9D|nr:signal peptidase I [Microbacterium sp. nov. GSS16]WCD93558.1 signal peptidase I [Microbacterium sp. nov. GSS16]
MSPIKTTRAIGNTLISVAVACAIALVGLMLVPSLFGLDRYVITGGSMSGAFERGTVVYERQVPVADLKVGDIITYVPPKDAGINEPVTHRILSIDDETDPDGRRVLRTQGDANASADPWTFTLESAVQPRVEGWVPAVGWVFILLSMSGVRMLAIGLPAAMIGLMFLRDLVRALRG